MIDDYTMCNEGAQVLTERNAAVNQPPILSNKQNQEPVHDETGYYHEMVNMFDEIAFNDEVIENKWITVDPAEKDDSECFTFDKATGGGGIIKLDDTYLTSDISVKYNGNILDAKMIIDYMPDPMEKWWKTVDVHANEVAMTNSHTDSLYVSDILSCLYVNNQKTKDLAGCTMRWRNVPSQENFLQNLRHGNRATTIANNKPAFQRVDSIVNKETNYYIDSVKFACYMAGPQYVSPNNRLTVKFTKDSSRIFTGHEHDRTGNANGTNSDFHIGNADDSAAPHANYTAHVVNSSQSATNLGNLDNVKVRLKNFKMYYKVLTAKAQLQVDINQNLDVKGKPVNVFYQKVHIRSEVHNLGNSKFSCTNVFGMNTPYVLIITLSRSAYINGDFYHPPTHWTWEKME